MESKGMVDHAIQHARMGFRVFPLVPNGKTPLIQEWQNEATQDKGKIREWWGQWPNANIAILAGKYIDPDKKDRYLVVVDVDVKDGKKGLETVEKLKKEEKKFPETLTTTTSTKGKHWYYWSSTPFKQGTNVLGEGIDSRCVGGYVVGAHSSIGSSSYSWVLKPIVPLPEWADSYNGPNTPYEKPKAINVQINQDTAEKRIIHYLEKVAPIAIQGQGGDHTTFKVAGTVKDFGIDSWGCLNLLLEHWNNRCEPPWGVEELGVKVENVYNYGKNPTGIKSPEADFPPLTKAAIEDLDKSEAKDPILKMNETFAFAIAGGGHRILWERDDHKGNFQVEQVKEESFHKLFASETLRIGDGKYKALSQLWITDKRRRTYDGICFDPSEKAPKNWYNLWKGFAVKPHNPAEKPHPKAQESLKLFLDHAFENVCNGNSEYFKWIIEYFAHIVQKPAEKPLTTLVFRGKKGTGKNALIDRVGRLLGKHYLTVSDKRYLVGQFNSHMENCIMLVLDEAFWSGDVSAEGTLKRLTTANTTQIERKGQESYTIDNFMRIVIIGNEDWLVPASGDERRYAVFDVGDGKRLNLDYFTQMREGMETYGGDRLLFSYLSQVEITPHLINMPPDTEGLHDQKLKSLDPLKSWWRQCLMNGKIIDFSEEWETDIAKESLREAYRNYIREHNMHRRYTENEYWILRGLQKCVPDLRTSKKIVEGKKLNIFKIPSLEECRAEWEKHIGHKEKWT